jgi:perosamine synthetase
MTTSASTLAIAGGPPAIPPKASRTWPDLTKADLDAVQRVLSRGVTSGPHAPEVTALQDEYRNYTGGAHCVAVNSGTAALHCALVANGVQPGDEVITSAFSFVATPMAILHAGATPVFCDIDPATFNIDPALIPALVTERTKAIMPVDIHGLVADVEDIGQIARRFQLAVVEDAAQAHGATFDGRMAGTFGDASGFSLNASKNLSAGEGGLVLCATDEMERAVRRLAIFGEDTPRPLPGEHRAYWSHAVGWNYRMHEVTAAMARAQLARLRSFNDQARRNAAILNSFLAELPGITPPYVPPLYESTYYGYRIRLDPTAFNWAGSTVEFRDRILYALQAEGVAADPWQHLPLPAQPLFRHHSYYQWSPGMPETPLDPWNPASFPRASQMFAESFCLGSDPHPLHIQDESLMTLYMAAFEKVIGNIDSVLTLPYEPVRLVPQIPASEL